MIERPLKRKKKIDNYS